MANDIDYSIKSSVQGVNDLKSAANAAGELEKRVKDAAKAAQALGDVRTDIDATVRLDATEAEKSASRFAEEIASKDVTVHVKAETDKVEVKDVDMKISVAESAKAAGEAVDALADRLSGMASNASTEALKASIADIKGQLNDIGNVDVGAVDDALGRMNESVAGFGTADLGPVQADIAAVTASVEAFRAKVVEAREAAKRMTASADTQAGRKSAEGKTDKVEVKGEVNLDTTEAGQKKAELATPVKIAMKANTDGVDAARQTLVGNVDALIAKANEYGTAAGKRMVNELNEIKGTLASAGEDISDDAIKGLNLAIAKLVEQGSKLPPKGLVKMGDTLVALVQSYDDFAKAHEKTNGIDFKFDVKGLDKFDTLQRKLELVTKAKGLDDGVKALDAAIADLSPEHAEEVAKSVQHLKKLLTEEMTDDNIKAINEELKALASSSSKFSSREIEKFAPAIDGARSSLRSLKDSMGPVGAEMRKEFDVSSFSASVLSGDVEGVTRGFIGLAAGARTTGVAIKTALATTGITAIVMAVTAIVSKMSDFVKFLINAGNEARKVRLENLEDDIDAVNERIDTANKLLEIEKQRIDDVTERYSSQIDVINELADATDGLAKSRELAAAKTQEEREAIEAKYEDRSSERGADASIRKAVSARNAYDKKTEKERERLENEKKRLSGLEASFAQQEVEMNAAIERLFQSGYGVKQDMPGGILTTYSPEQMEQQWRFNGGDKIGGFDHKIPKEIVDRWEKAVVTYMTDEYGSMTWAINKRWGGESAKEAFDSGKKPYLDNYAALKTMPAEIKKMEADLAHRDSQGAKEAKMAVDTAIANYGKMMSDYVTKSNTIIADAENARADANRAQRENMASSSADESARAGIIRKRIAEREGWISAYRSGGTNEYGRTIARENSEDGLRKEYERNVKEYNDLLAARIAHERVNAGLDVTAEERELAKSWKANSGRFDELSKIVRNTAEKLKGAIDKTRQFEDALNALKTELLNEARSRFESGKGDAVSFEQERFQRDEAQAGRDYQRTGRGGQMAMSANWKREAEQELFGTTDEQQVRNEALAQSILAKRAEGTALTYEESSFAANAGENALQRVARGGSLDSSSVMSKLVDDADKRMLEGIKGKLESGVSAEDLRDDEKKFYAELSDERQQYLESLKLLTDEEKRLLELRQSRAKNWVEREKSNIERMNLDRREERYGRAHDMQREEERRQYDLNYGRVGASVQVGMAAGREADSKARFEAAQRIETMDDSGALAKIAGKKGGAKQIRKMLEDIGVTVSKEELAEIVNSGSLTGAVRARVGQAFQEGRSDYSGARDQRLQGEENMRQQRAEFTQKALTQSNRLTAMGLGGDVADWNKKTADNTNTLVELTKQLVDASGNNVGGGWRSETRWASRR